MARAAYPCSAKPAIAAATGLVLLQPPGGLNLSHEDRTYIGGGRIGLGHLRRPRRQLRHAPWCAVQNLGAGDVVWDCEFRTVDECAPHVIAGNRGFCNINPSFAPPVFATPVRHRKRHI